MTPTSIRMARENTKIIVAHARRHHLYHTAAAYAREGWLGGFVTEVFVGNTRPLRFIESLGVPWLSPAAMRLRGYSSPELNSYVKLYPSGSLQSVAFKLLGSRPRFSAIPWLEAVANECEQADACHMCCGQAISTFERLQGSGKLLILEQITGHRRLGTELLSEEYSLFGREVLTHSGFSEAIVARNDAELALADVVVAGSSFVRGTLIDMGIAPDKIILAQYGADTSLFSRRTPPLRRKPHEPLEIAFVGNDFVRKGLRYLVAAIERMPPGTMNLNVFGNGDRHGSLFNTQHQSVRFHGSLPRASLIERLEKCHVAVLPSIWEGSAYATLETMSLMLPGIFTPNTGSVVTDGVDGFIVAIRDPAAIADRLTLLLEDDLRLAMGAEALSTARRHTWTAYGESLLTGLREMASVGSCLPSSLAHPFASKQV